MVHRLEHVAESGDSIGESARGLLLGCARPAADEEESTTVVLGCQLLGS